MEFYVFYWTFEISNEEVKYIFRTKVLKWFQDRVKTKDLSNLYTAIINGDASTFETELGRYDKELASEGYKNIIRYGISFFEKDCFVKLDVEDN